MKIKKYISIPELAKKHTLLAKKEINFDNIRRALKATTAQKLRWLEEMQDFTIRFTPRSILLRSLRLRAKA